MDWMNIDDVLKNSRSKPADFYEGKRDVGSWEGGDATINFAEIPQHEKDSAAVSEHGARQMCSGC